MEIKEEKVKIKLASNRINLIVKELDKVLDEYRVYGQEWNKQVIKALILDNLTKDTSIELIEELNNTSISEWND